MYEHKISLLSKHKYYPVVNCSLPSSAKGAVESFLSSFCGYRHAPRPEMSKADMFAVGVKSILLVNDVGLQTEYAGLTPSKHLKSLQYGVSKEDPYFDSMFRYEQYSDLPWTYSYKVFDDTFPNAKFILTERNPEDWYLNVLGFWRQQIDLNKWCNPILNDYWSLEKIPPITCDLRGPSPLIDFQGLPFDEDTTSTRAQVLMHFYKNYNQQVKDYFKGKKKKLLLLETPIEKKEFKLIADFLEKPMPKFGFFGWQYTAGQQTGYGPMAKKQTTSK